VTRLNIASQWQYVRRRECQYVLDTGILQTRHWYNNVHKWYWKSISSRGNTDRAIESHWRCACSAGTRSPLVIQTGIKMIPRLPDCHGVMKLCDVGIFKSDIQNWASCTEIAKTDEWHDVMVQTFRRLVVPSSSESNVGHHSDTAEISRNLAQNETSSHYGQQWQ